ncbi:hypothetical protein T310_3733 [Rasamsonia emersonii CBS 393.64]|uniref:Uncharacterized protein n=1 Tax=Rasamsonia emersonii (strain ATCC 16479 / CBS 393.64 / IMI 116815) TaxID=1408163 RepID=A0A0F4YX98_RASE3|nr:hypothetical protein T310_3733 [Rasamsonia emersonii CBS 393.64]KKA22238.1 hypothetical protein T310_3733 [Rasamsonia emersonii CBS 393.64]
MAPRIGNAWAEEKERERQRQLKMQCEQESTYSADYQTIHEHPSPRDGGPVRTSILQQGSTMSSTEKPRTSHALNYDEDLAIAMPRPRPAGRELHPSKSSPAIRHNAAVRSFTDPFVISTDNDIHPLRNASTLANVKAADSKSPKEKKSMLKTLKSKLSLKDIIKEANKDSKKNVKETTPKRASPPGFPDWDWPLLSPDNPALHIFNPRNSESENMMMSAPAPCGQDVNSAFPCSSKSTVQTACSGRTLPAAPFVLWTPEKPDKPETPESTHTEYSPLEKGTSSRYVASFESVKDMMMPEDASPFRTTCRSCGQPTVVKVQQRVVSMKDEKERSQVLTPTQEIGRTKVARRETDQKVLCPEQYSQVWEEARLRTPLTHDNIGSEREGHPNTKLQHYPHPPFCEEESGRKTADEKESKSEHLSFSSDQGGQPSLRGYPLSSSSVFKPETPTHRGSQHSRDVSDIDSEAFLAGTTGRGGYAPAPPQSDYQGSLTLEQQLTSVELSLHHHINNTVAKLTRVICDGNNWVDDQNMRGLDRIREVFESSRALMSNMAAQNSKSTTDLAKLVSELRDDIRGIREEMRRMDDAHTDLIRKESTRLNTRINSLEAEVSHIHRKLGSETGPTWPLPPNLQPQNKKSESDLKATSVTELPTDSSNAQSETIPTHRVTFCTPSDNVAENREDNPSYSRECTSTAWSRHLENSSTGSPTPKRGREMKDGDLDHGTALATTTSQASSVTDENKKPGKNEPSTKSTPHRKGYFSFGRHKAPKTPGRGGEDSKRGNNVEKTSSSSLAASCSSFGSNVPQLPYPHQDAAEDLSSLSPSKVHPALRTPYQRHILRERELHQQRQQQEKEKEEQSQMSQQGRSALGRGPTTSPYRNLSLNVDVAHSAGIGGGVPVFTTRPRLAPSPLPAHRPTERPVTPPTADPSSERSGASWYEEEHGEGNWI